MSSTPGRADEVRVNTLPTTGGPGGGTEPSTQGAPGGGFIKADIRTGFADPIGSFMSGSERHIKVTLKTQSHREIMLTGIFSLCVQSGNLHQ